MGLQEYEPPRGLTEAETAHLLGMSVLQLYRRRADLVAMGLPRRLPLIGRDRVAIHAWLDMLWGTRSADDVRPGVIALRLAAFANG